MRHRDIPCEFVGASLYDSTRGHPCLAQHFGEVLRLACGRSEALENPRSTRALDYCAALTSVPTMSNNTYNQEWQDAMCELNEQVHIEDPNLGLEEGETPSQPVKVEPVDAFNHWACLYIKYVQCFDKLEKSYDSIVHPQKRLLLKNILVTVMARVVELKQLLIKWNPKPPPLKDEQRPVPFNYVNFDDILVDLKLPPDTLEVPVPRYFVEDRELSIKNRNKLIQGFMNLKLNVRRLELEEDRDIDTTMVEYTLDEALELIQRNERGRQGRARGKLMKELREEESDRKMFMHSTTSDVDPDIAAANIQRIFRGGKERRKVLTERDSELVFIGMKRIYDPEAARIEEEAKSVREQRKQVVRENKELYERSLSELHETLLEEEGPFIREREMDKRREWFTNHLYVLNTVLGLSAM